MKIRAASIIESYLARQGHSTARRRCAIRPAADDCRCHPRLTVFDRLARARGQLLNSIDDRFSRPMRPDAGRAGPRHAAGRSQLRRARPDHRISENRCISRAGPGGTSTSGALAVFFMWAGRRLHASLILQNIRHSLRARRVRRYCRRPAADCSRRSDGGALPRLHVCCFWRMELLNISCPWLRSCDSRRAAVGNQLTRVSYLSFSRSEHAIGALAIPWIAKSSEPYLRGLTNT